MMEKGQIREESKDKKYTLDKIHLFLENMMSLVILLQNAISLVIIIDVIHTFLL